MKSDGNHSRNLAVRGRSEVITTSITTIRELLPLLLSKSRSSFACTMRPPIPHTYFVAHAPAKLSHQSASWKRKAETTCHWTYWSLRIPSLRVRRPLSSVRIWWHNAIGYFFIQTRPISIEDTLNQAQNVIVEFWGSQIHSTFSLNRIN